MRTGLATTTGPDRVGKDQDGKDYQVDGDHVDNNNRVRGDPVVDRDWVGDQREDNKDEVVHSPC